MNDLHARPTRIQELFPSAPYVIQADDACKFGMGRVFFTPGNDHNPLCLWRAPFPDNIVNDVVSWENPKGSITNSDLELAGTVAGMDVAAHSYDLRERTQHVLTDNTPALAWQTKGSTTTTGPAAYLLRLCALHQRFHRYVSLFDHIPGRDNQMADDCSRLWHLSDAQLLSHFDATYPQKHS